MMRFIIIILAFTLSPFVLAQNEVEIKGQITNPTVVYSPMHEDLQRAAVVFYLLDEVGDEEAEVAYPDEIGNFKLKIKVSTKGQAVNMKYADQEIPLFFYPEDDLSISFDNNNFLHSLKYEGKAMARSKYLLEKTKGFGAENVMPGGSFTKRSTLMKLMEDFKDQQLAFLDKFKSSNELEPHFVNWAKSEIEYGFANEVIEQEYVYDQESFFRKVGTSNHQAIPSIAYRDFIDHYVRFLTREKSPDSDKRSYSIRAYEYGHRYLVGSTHDMITGFLMYNLVKAELDIDITENLDVFYRDCRTDLYKETVRNAYTDWQEQLNQPLPDNAHLLKLKDGQDFLSFLEQYKGKVVYLDFWAGWCKPCVEVMPMAQILKEKLGDDVVFLYVSQDKSDASWHKNIARFKIGGEHIRLADTELETVNFMFDIQGIPHYVLIDKEGKFANLKASPPGDPELVNEINSLLR